MGKRVLAIVVLLIVAVIAIRLAVGLVVGAVTAVFWIAVVAALAVGALWARRTLKSAKRARAVKRGSGREVAAAPTEEDRVEAEMRRITEQLREQGRS